MIIPSHPDFCHRPKARPVPARVSVREAFDVDPRLRVISSLLAFLFFCPMQLPYSILQGFGIRPLCLSRLA